MSKSTGQGLFSLFREVGVDWMEDASADMKAGGDGAGGVDWVYRLPLSYGCS